MSTPNTDAARYVLAHRDLFNADWRDGNAYHMGDESPVWTDFDAACAASDNVDETCGWETIVVELDPGVAPGSGSKPRIVYG